MDFNELKLAKANEVKKDYVFDFQKNKYLIYTCLFYSFGLFLGAYFYKITQAEVFNKVLEIKSDSLSNLFFSNLVAYISLYLITAFLGFCLISKPIINIIPSLIGIFFGSRIGYYFINFGYKGVVFSLIMIVPFISLYITILSFVIKESIDLSEKLIALAKGEGGEKIDLPPYLKKYMLYFLIIIAIALLSSGLTKLLLSVVTI